MAGSCWCTQLRTDCGSAQVLELNLLNFNLSPPPTSQKVAFHQIVKTSRNLPYKKNSLKKKRGYESVNFRLRRARPEIHRPWTCSRSHTYMHHSDPQIHLLWSYNELVLDVRVVTAAEQVLYSRVGGGLKAINRTRSLLKIPCVSRIGPY